MWGLLEKLVVVWKRSEAVTFFFSLVQVPPCIVMSHSAVMVEMDTDVEMELDLNILGPWYRPCRIL